MLKTTSWPAVCCDLHRQEQKYLLIGPLLHWLTHPHSSIHFIEHTISFTRWDTDIATNIIHCNHYHTPFGIDRHLHSRLFQNKISESVTG